MHSEFMKHKLDLKVVASVLLKYTSAETTLSTMRNLVLTLLLCE